MDLLNEFLEKEDIRYFYHVTNTDCNEILENGLYMVEKELYTTMIELPDEFYKDPISYSKGEKGMKGTYRENGNLVIIGIANKDINDAVRKVDYIPNEWNLDDRPNYYLPNEYILGYIDSDEEEFIFNEEFRYNDTYSI